MMGVCRIPFDKPSHKPGRMTSNLGDEAWVLTCLELSCENSVVTTNLQQDCQGVCEGTCVVITCVEDCEGEWKRL
jgi:hypothetical protein